LLLGLEPVVGAASQREVCDCGRPAESEREDVVVLEQAASAAAMAIAVDVGALAAVPQVDLALDVGRDVARVGLGLARRLRPVGEGEPLALEPGEGEREDAVEDLGQVAAGDAVAKQIAGALDLVVKLGRVNWTL
jgi:hypothetical protein